MNEEYPESLKVFIVEIIYRFVICLKYILRKPGIFKLLANRTGADDFLEKINNKNPDFVTMDIKLKESSGLMRLKVL